MKRKDLVHNHVLGILISSFFPFPFAGCIAEGKPPSIFTSLALLQLYEAQESSLESTHFSFTQQSGFLL